MEKLEAVLSHSAFPWVYGFSLPWLLAKVFDQDGWAIVGWCIFLALLYFEAYISVIVLNILRDNPDIDEDFGSLWSEFHSRLFSRPAVVVADAGAIGHHKFWRWDSAEEWGNLHRPLFDFVSTAMPSREVEEFEDWLDELLYPHRREWS